MAYEEDGKGKRYENPDTYDDQNGRYDGNDKYDRGSKYDDTETTVTTETTETDKSGGSGGDGDEQKAGTTDARPVTNDAAPDISKTDKVSDQAGSGNGKRSLLSRLLGTANQGVSDMVNGARSGFMQWLQGFRSGTVAAVSKISKFLGLSNTTTSIIIAVIVGGGIIFYLGTLDIRKMDDIIKNDEPWKCVGSVIDVKGGLGGGDEDIQENVNIMYDVFVNGYGYSEEFLIAMVSCFMVESHVTAEIIEHGGGEGAEQTFFASAGSASGGPDSGTAQSAYWSYGNAFAANANVTGGYYDGAGNVCPGLGIVQWTGERGNKLLQGMDVVDGYYWYDLPYQLAFLLAEFETSYQSLKPDSGEWQGRDAYDMTVFFFTTFVSGGNSDPSLVSLRTDNIPDATSYVMAAAANSQFTGDVQSMASILAGSDLAANAKRREDATICTNGSALSTAGIVPAAISVAWLEGADYDNENTAYLALRRSTLAPFIINDKDFVDGIDGGGTVIINPVTGRLTSSGKADLVACTQYYYLAHLMVIPNETGKGAPGYFSSCDRSVATPVRMSGHDDSFPAGGPVAQLCYMLTGSSHSAGDADQGDSLNDAFDPGDLAAFEGTRNADGNVLWNPIGYMRGDVLYSYNGAATIPSGTIMVSMGNQDAPTGVLPSRFVDMYNPTTRHIMIYSGAGAVQSAYGDYLFDQKSRYASTMDKEKSQTGYILDLGDEEREEAHRNGTYGYGWIKEEYAWEDNDGKIENAFFLDYGDFKDKIPDIMREANAFKRKYAPFGNDQKESFYTAGEEKNGLNDFKSWEEIRHDIKKAHPEWSSMDVQLFTEMIYEQQQHNRFMLTTQYCSVANEEDAAIGIYYDNLDGIDQNAYVNGYQYMPAHMTPDGDLIGPKESLITEESKYWIDEEINEQRAPLAHEYFQFNTVISNDLFQDLIQSWSKKEDELEEIYHDLGYKWGLTPEDFGEVDKTTMNNEDYENIMMEYADLFVPIAIEEMNTEYNSIFAFFDYDPEENHDPDSEDVYKDEFDHVPTWIKEHYEYVDSQIFQEAYLIVNADDSHLPDDQDDEHSSELREDVNNEDGLKNLYGDNWLDNDHEGKEPFRNTHDIYTEQDYEEWERFDLIEEQHKNIAEIVELPGHEDKKGHYEVISRMPDTVLAVNVTMQWTKTAHETDNPDYDESDPDSGSEKSLTVSSHLSFTAHDEFWAHDGWDYKDNDYYQWRYLDEDGNELTYDDLYDKFVEEYPEEEYGPEEDPTEDGETTYGEELNEVHGENGILVYVQIDDKDFGTWDEFRPSQSLGYRYPRRDYMIQLRPENLDYSATINSENTDLVWPNEWTAEPGEDWESELDPDEERPSYGYPRPDKTKPYIKDDDSGDVNAYSFILVNKDGLLCYEHLDSEDVGTGKMTRSYLQEYTKDTHYLINTMTRYIRRVGHVTEEALWGVHTSETPAELYTGTAADWANVNGLTQLPDFGGSPGGYYSLISKIAGFDHVMHIGLGGLESPRRARDDATHKDEYGNEIEDFEGNFAHWVIHGSRGTRGPKIEYLDFYGFFEQEGKKFSYMLFASTPEPHDSDVCKCHINPEKCPCPCPNCSSEYKRLIDEYNARQEASRPLD